jgi:VanZ family protein
MNFGNATVSCALCQSSRFSFFLLLKVSRMLPYAAMTKDFYDRKQSRQNTGHQLNTNAVPGSHILQAPQTNPAANLSSVPVFGRTFGYQAVPAQQHQQRIDAANFQHSYANISDARQPVSSLVSDRQSRTFGAAQQHLPPVASRPLTAAHSLNGMLMSCMSIVELSSLIDTHRYFMDAVNISTCLHVIARQIGAKSVHIRYMKTLLEIANDMLAGDRFAGQSIANSLWSIAKIYAPSGLAESNNSRQNNHKMLGADEASGNVTQNQSQNLVIPGEIQRTLLLLCVRAMSHSREFLPQNISNSIWALAKVKMNQLVFLFSALWRNITCACDICRCRRRRSPR